MEKHWKKAIRHIIGDFENYSFSDELFLRITSSFTHAL